MSTEHPIYYKGRVIARKRTHDDGTVELSKPGVVRPEHVMRMTGAPGWDRKAVDESFPEGVDGVLTYTDGRYKYSIPIALFREKSFVRDLGDGEQYHVHIRNWTSDSPRTVDPLRAAKRGDSRQSAAEPPAPVKLGKLEFGAVIPCDKCKTTGIEPGKRTVACKFCGGAGFFRRSGNGSRGT